MNRARVVGTIAWARRTGGRLSTLDQLRLAGQALEVQLARLPRGLARRLGLSRRTAPLDLAPLTAPDTAIAKVAEHALAATSPPSLVHHGYRSYAWGRLLAARDGELLAKQARTRKGSRTHFLVSRLAFDRRAAVARWP